MLKMKRRIIFTVAIILTLAIFGMIYNSFKTLQKQKELSNVQASLHEVLKRLGRNDLSHDKSTIIVFFNSECDICQFEIEQIGRKISMFGSHQLLLVSFETENEALDFLKSHNLSDYYLKSSYEEIGSVFRGGIPQTFVYDSGRLIKKYKGEVKIEVILNTLAER